MLGISVLTVPYDVVGSYIKPLSIELSFGVEDTKDLKSRIENVHLRNALETAIIEKDYEGANILLKDALEELKEKKQYTDIINNLVSQIREYKSSIKKSFINKKELGQLKNKVLNAKSADEKGKTLENLAKYLFEKINGLKIIQTRLRLEAEEIDLILSNSAFINWGDPIIIECKNWTKPVPKNDVVAFIDKVETVGAITGVLIAMNGVTGNEYKDAYLKIREALSKKKIRILVITWEELDKVNTGDEWVNLLKSRYYLPSKLIEKPD